MVSALGTGGHLEVTGAVVRFGATPALDGLELTVEAGEVVAVLGPSGSGKSTLLRVVAGLQDLDAGQVSIDGRDLHGVPTHRRGVGLMFQDHALFPHRDVAGNVGFGLRMAGWARPAIAARVAELLALVGLPGYEGRAVRTLSGGEQQRVALARALAPSPRVLLLDEPLGALDRPLRERLVGELRELVTELGLTVVAVTHDHQEAFALADRVAVVDAGRVLQVGAPATVWARPAGLAVARVLGLPNLLAGTVRDGVLSGPWGALEVPGPDGPTTVHVPPGALHPDPAGALRGSVRAVRLRGHHQEIEVALVDDSVLVVPAGRGPVPAVGTPLLLRADPSDVVRLEG